MGFIQKNNIRATNFLDPDFRRMEYARYANDFLIAITGPKSDAIKLKQEISNLLSNELSLNLNLDKTKITHATTDKAKFLGFLLYTSTYKVAGNKGLLTRSNGVLAKRVPSSRIDAPILKIIEKLNEKYFTKKRTCNGVVNYKPTCNYKYQPFDVTSIIKQHLAIYRGYLNYYSPASNFNFLARRLDYILRYSFIQTMTRKLNLRRRMKVIEKFGKELTTPFTRQNGAYKQKKSPETLTFPTSNPNMPAVFPSAKDLIKTLKNMDKNPKFR